MNDEIIERFLDSRRPSEPDDEVPFLKKSALRWCSNVPIEHQYVTESTEIAMDRFIDQWLHFLPIPRYAREYAFTSTDMKECMNLSLDALGFAGSNTEGTLSNSVAYQCFITMWPHLKALRDPSLSLETQALLLCLLALDPLASLSIDRRVVYSKTFPDVALLAIKEDVPIRSSNVLNDVLRDVNEYLITRQLAKFTSKQEGFIPWQEAKERGLTNNEIDTQVHAYLMNAVKRSRLPIDILRPRIGLKNFVDEVPEIQLIN
jgi:hypothetical protein